MSKPLVSVVLCCYNGAKYLAQQVDSILAQTYRPLELIISDDASTDNTRQVLGKYVNDPSVRLFYREKNAGLAKNFSFAAEKAKGDFIAFSDQDDIWLPNKIEALIEARGDFPLVYSDSLLVDEDGNSMNKKLSDLKQMYSGPDSRGYILYSCVWGHGMLITRALLQKSSPMPPEVHHDIWLAFQAFLYGGIRYHNLVLTHYRQHSSSTSKTLPQKQATRPHNERYEDYLKKLHWIGLMQKHERQEYQAFYKKLLRLYTIKGEGRYVWPLFWFMLRNRKAFFMFSKKGFFSQLVEIMKQARGERID